MYLFWGHLLYHYDCILLVDIALWFLDLREMMIHLLSLPRKPKRLYREKHNLISTLMICITQCEIATGIRGRIQRKGSFWDFQFLSFFFLIPNSKPYSYVCSLKAPPGTITVSYVPHSTGPGQRIQQSIDSCPRTNVLCFTMHTVLHFVCIV